MTEGAVPLKTENLSVVFSEENEEVTALDSLDLIVNPGEIYGLYGIKEAGKTTFIRSVLGRVRPHTGSVEIFGRPPDDYHSRIQTGYVPEEPMYRGFLPGREILRSAALHSGIAERDVSYEVDRVIRETALGVLTEQKVKSYTAGQIRRLAAAEALLNRPKLLLLDEPGTGLNTAGVHWLIELIRKLRDRGVAILITADHISEVEKTADRVGILHRGVLTGEAEMQEIDRRSTIEEFFVQHTSD